LLIIKTIEIGYYIPDFDMINDLDCNSHILAFILSRLFLLTLEKYNFSYSFENEYSPYSFSEGLFCMLR